MERLTFMGNDFDAIIDHRYSKKEIPLKVFNCVKKNSFDLAFIVPDGYTLRNNGDYGYPGDVCVVDKRCDPPQCSFLKKHEFDRAFYAAEFKTIGDI